MSQFTFHDQVADPGSPGATKVTLYTKVGRLYSKDSAGTVIEYEIGGGGGGALTTTNINWVDKAGNDGTALPDRADLPYLTIAAALAAAASGDAVIVRPGAYNEAALIIGAGVSLVSDAGFEVTEITASAVGISQITLSDGSYLQGFTITVPDSATAIGVVHTAGSAVAYDLQLSGDGATGAGIGFKKTGTGKVVGGNIRLGVGGFSAMISVDAGVIALDDVHAPGAVGDIDALVLVGGTGRFQSQGMNIGNANVTDCLRVSGTATVLVFSPNWTLATNGVHIQNDGVSISLVGGKLFPATLDFLVDAGTYTAASTIEVTAAHLGRYSFPPTGVDVAFSMAFLQSKTQQLDAAFRVFGTNLVAGFPELGASISSGEGAPYSAGQVVLTSDGTAAPGNDGGSFVDVSVDAGSRSGSTFTFQGVTAGHSILWCTPRVDAAGVALRHYGVVIEQTGAAVLGGGSFIFEIQSSANNWTPVSVMAVSDAEQYVYANSVFLRAPSTEAILPAISSATTWPATTINGVTGRWVRARIDSTITTAPVFERQRLSPSAWNSNAGGQVSAKGLAQWRSQLFGVGNVWGEIGGGGVADANVAVGSGGAPTGWTSKIKKALFNGAGDSISFQFALPDGLCTAFPLTFDLTYSLVGAAPITVAPSVILSALVLGSGGVLIADSGGAVVPVARADTAAETFTSKAATTFAVSTATGTVQDRQLKMQFGPLDISDYYEGDGVVMALELDSDGTPAQDLVIWTLAVSGVRFTTGGRL